jgi:hypothetical protein
MWLSNIEAWAQGVARVLAPDGRLVVIDYHPFALLFDPKGVRDANYFAGGRPRSSINGLVDYVGEAGPAEAPWGFLEGVSGFVNPHRSHEFFWGVGEILSAVLSAGLRIEAFVEYPYSNGSIFEDMTRSTTYRGRYELTSGPNLPLMFSLVARRPAAAAQ